MIFFFILGLTAIRSATSFRQSSFFLRHSWRHVVVLDYKNGYTSSSDFPVYPPVYLSYRVTSLEETLNFFAKNFGLQIISHEEVIDDADSAWSKTLIASPNVSLAIELLYTYGKYFYRRGNDIRYLAIDESSFKGDSASVLVDIQGRKFIETPDELWVCLNSGKDQDSVSEVLTLPSPTCYVSFHVQDIQMSKKKILQNLNRSWSIVSESDDSQSASSIMLAHSSSFGRVGLELVQLPVEFGQLSRSENLVGLAYTCDDIAGGGSVIATDGYKCVTIPSCATTPGKRRASVDWTYHKQQEDLAIARHPRQPLVEVDSSGIVRTSPAGFQDALGQFAGAPLLVELVTSSCPRCVDFGLELSDLANKLYKIGIRVLVVDVEDRRQLRLCESLDLQMMAEWTRSAAGGLPSLFFWSDRQSYSAVHFEGRLDANLVLDWVLQMSRSPIGEGETAVGSVSSDGVGPEEKDEDEDDCDACSL